MRLISEVKSGFVDLWDCYDDITPDTETMLEYCEGFSERSPYLIDEVIGDLEGLGNTKAKSWTLFNDSSKKLMKLKVDFKNGFYICFGVDWIGGKVF